MPDMQLVVATFAGEEYGIPITQVQEIIKLFEITRIPNMRAFLEGVVNLRGKIIPVIDFEKRFGLPVKEKDGQSRIIITHTASQWAGLIADSVSEVINIRAEFIEAVPPLFAKINADFLTGVAKIDSRIILILNLESIFGDIEKMSLKS